MSRIAVIGEQAAVQGFGLAGALVLGAEDPAQVRRAWQRVPDDVAVVVLTRRAAQALPGPPERPGRPLVVVM